MITDNPHEVDNQLSRMCGVDEDGFIKVLRYSDEGFICRDQSKNFRFYDRGEVEGPISGCFAFTRFVDIFGLVGYRSNLEPRHVVYLSSHTKVWARNGIYGVDSRFIRNQMNGTFVYTDLCSIESRARGYINQESLAYNDLQRDGYGFDILGAVPLGACEIILPKEVCDLIEIDSSYLILPDKPHTENEKILKFLNKVYVAIRSYQKDRLFFDLMSEVEILNPDILIYNINSRYFDVEIKIYFNLEMSISWSLEEPGMKTFSDLPIFQQQALHRIISLVRSTGDDVGLEITHTPVLEDANG